MKTPETQSLIDFLNRLDESGIHYSLDHCRAESIMVEITVPGERWEVEFMSDGAFEVEIFRSGGDILGAEAIEDLFKRFVDPRDPSER